MKFSPALRTFGLFAWWKLTVTKSWKGQPSRPNCSWEKAKTLSKWYIFTPFNTTSKFCPPEAPLDYSIDGVAKGREQRRHILIEETPPWFLSTALHYGGLQLHQWHLTVLTLERPGGPERTVRFASGNQPGVGGWGVAGGWVSPHTELRLWSSHSPWLSPLMPIEA